MPCCSALASKRWCSWSLLGPMGTWSCASSSFHNLQARWPRRQTQRLMIWALGCVSCLADNEGRRRDSAVRDYFPALRLELCVNDDVGDVGDRLAQLLLQLAGEPVGVGEG